MTRQCVVIVCAIALSAVSHTATGEQSASLRLVLDRYRNIMLESGPPAVDTVRRYVGEIGSDGTWGDVDYTDTDRAGWKTTAHLSRLREMSLACVYDGSELKNDPQLLKAIYGGLDHWIARRYQNTNWWFNEIGVPRTMRDIAILLGDRLDGDRFNGVLDVIDQVKVRGTGANLMWTAELSLHHGCLAGDTAEVEAAVAKILGEILVGAPEGIQVDGSYYQHSSRLQTFHYGKAYLDVACKLAWQLRETPWAFPDEKRDIITQYIFDGPQWMCRGTVTVPGTIDRMVSRKNSLRSADLRPLLKLWRDVHPDYAASLDAFIERQNGDREPLSGFRHFPRGDFTVYHRPGFSMFIKTISDRTLPAEHINNENLKGHNLNSGDHYLLVNGEEYNNLQPVWDWERLPGVTTAERAPDIERRAFTGGIGNGDSGFSVMDCRRAETDSTKAATVLAVRKLWAFHDDLVLCLMSGWRVEGLDGFIYTALDQRRLNSVVTCGFGDSTFATLEEGYHRRDDVRWVLHDGVAYAPLEPSTMTIEAGEASGSWYDINRQYADERVTERIFLVEMNHDAPPQPTGYLIVPNTDRQKIEDMLDAPSWRITRNDSDCQCVSFPGGVTMAAFYVPGKAAPEGFLPLSVDTPCLALWNNEMLRLSDPTNEGRRVSVKWGKSAFTVDLPPGGGVESVSKSNERSER